MQEAIQQPTSSLEATDPIVAAALRAEAWAGEPFLRDGEDPAEALAEGTARRRALKCARPSSGAVDDGSGEGKTGSAALGAFAAGGAFAARS